MAQHRHHPRALLVGAGRARAGARRLTADVQHVGAFGAQPFAVGDGGFGAGMQAAVGEGVGRDVDDAHHPRPARSMLKRVVCQCTDEQSKTGPAGPV